MVELLLNRAVSSVANMANWVLALVAPLFLSGPKNRFYNGLLQWSVLTMNQEETVIGSLSILICLFLLVVELLVERWTLCRVHARIWNGPSARVEVSPIPNQGVCGCCYFHGTSNFTVAH